MPRIEQVRHGTVRILAAARRVPAAIGARTHLRLLPKQRATLLFPLVLALAVASIIIAARSAPGCTPIRQAASTPTFTKSRLCRPTMTIAPLTAH